MSYSIHRVGGETRVNTSLSGEQRYLSFAQLSDGRLLATWYGTGTQTGQQDEYGFFHQVFDANLNPIGDEVRTNATTTGVVSFTHVLPLADGRWTGVWGVDLPSSPALLDGIYYQTFDSAGRVGEEARIDDLPYSPGWLPLTRKLADGGFMVVWSGGSTQTGQDDNGIFYQRFDSTGAPAGSVTRVNTTVEGTQSFGRFVELSGGNFGIVWDGNGTQADHVDDDGAFLQRFDADGHAIGTEILINNPTSDASESFETSVGLTDGGWVITYDQSGNHTWQQAFNADGSKRGGPTKLTPEEGTDTSPSTKLKALADGKWVTLWQEGESPASADLYYQVFNADGRAAGVKSLVSASTEGMQSIYDIVELPNGGFVVAWGGKGTQLGQEDTNGYFFQRFDASGAKVGGETRINTTVEGDTGFLNIVALPTGHIVAVWDNDVSQTGQPPEVEVFQQVFDANGDRVGTETRVATSTVGLQSEPIVEVLSDGSWIVSWHGNGTQPGQEDTHEAGSESGGAFFQRFQLRAEGEPPPPPPPPPRTDLVMVGTKGANRLTGQDGNDKLYGKAGKDVLTGGAGKDVFVFDTKPSKKNLDTITDFSVADDTIWLDNKVFKKLGKKGSEAKPAKLNKKFFSLEKAKGKDDYLVYSKKKGILYYDADGSGAGKAVEIAKMAKKLKLTANDFFVV
ncbi:calcium-binding protein [Microvirga lenta]|uniref:calcium-binding protein n=1 Tax=Microvirga lenta TaxID=2881337 RepID=UPI001CFF9813|nr:calcium-binding protein [Microvirga lenta]MCB5176858.1 hypothetical protein [Microvirga lenta]